MQLPDLLRSVLVPVVVVSVLGWLMRSASRKARSKGEQMIVEYGRTFKGLVWFLWVVWLSVGLAMSIAIFRGEGENAKTSPSESLCIILGFLLLVLVLHLETFRVCIHYDQEGLHLRSPWRRDRFVPWAAVRSIRYNSMASWYEADTEGYGKIRLPAYLSGLRDLLYEFQVRGMTPPAGPFR